ncbi:peptidoglycan DD-metalloendopeptidase family protein [Flexilinea flocculi]|uniref:Protein containing WD40-like beta propeller repeat n=1 Tax=Flexilinea flocculi TaxID=1678840 RepID=A0A0S7BVF3_9CHLR|nr:peptidoglycan DD-metalloendopeptidase family protein [Flexilinea flocculi]GAP40467.1 protein containing WD40-like beta propeller repeat [Flexilinea flocculi]
MFRKFIKLIITNILFLSACTPQAPIQPVVESTSTIGNKLETQRPSNDSLTPTGFYWPTGTDNWVTGGPYMGQACKPPYTYDAGPGTYHIGWDIMQDENTSVRAIADGQVDWVSTGGWADDDYSTATPQVDQNVALVIKHKLNDGTSFFAVYGHIRTDLMQNATVTAGEAIGTIGPWKYGTHLHFGIYESAIMPTKHGRLPCPALGDAFEASMLDEKQWRNPYVWITTKYPGNYLENTASSNSVASFGALAQSITSNQLHGKIVFVASKTVKPNSLEILDLDSNQRRQIAHGNEYLGPTFSPDGTKIAYYTTNSGLGEINIYDETDQSTKQIVKLDVVDSRSPLEGGGFSYSIAWSPDGQRIAFLIPDSILISDIEGKEVRKIAKAIVPGSLSWSLDGSKILFSASKPEEPQKAMGAIFLLNIEDGKIEKFIEDDNYHSRDVEYSPDGLQIIYNTSKKDGTSHGELHYYVMDLQSGVVKEILGADYLYNPHWASSHEILFEKVDLGGSGISAINLISNEIYSVIQPPLIDGGFDYYSANQ